MILSSIIGQTSSDVIRGGNTIGVDRAINEVTIHADGNVTFNDPTPTPPANTLPVPTTTVGPNSVTHAGGPEYAAAAETAAKTGEVVTYMATEGAKNLQEAGQFLAKETGTVYKLGYNGNTAASAATVSAAKASQNTLVAAAKYARVGGAAVGGVVAAVDVYSGGGSNQSWARGTVGGVSTASVFIPVVGPFVALGLNVVNVSGGFNWLYNGFDNTPRWGNPKH
jgi:hypothetical protein